MFLDKIIKFIEDNGFGLTINTNPSEEEIARILKQIEKNKIHARMIIDMYKTK